MKLLSSKRRVAIAAAVIVLLLFMVRPGASRLKTRIAGTISAAVGRPVEIGSVHIRWLPRPGFDLENLVVYETPAFGAEPMLRAAEVTADLRLTSLARGRLEIARLDLTEPSLNLVRGENGRWNLETLLERTASTPLAPTAKSKSEPRPGFPYIAASSGRVNFKIGQEKKPYALVNADFALWQDSENAWGVRLKAQPFRSDLNLSDTGILRVNGTWERAASVRDTPLQFSLEWERPQLGQLTKFLTGRDRGWRGAVQLDATLAGTPAKLQVSSDGSIRDFRRYDISGGGTLVLAAHCDAQYSSVDRSFHELFCRGPVGDGMVSLRGDAGLPGVHRYNLVLTAEQLPVSALAALAQRAKKNLPLDLAAEGSVEGSFAIRNDGGSGEGDFAGRGEISGLHLASASNKALLDVASIPFALASGNFVTQIPSRKKGLAGTARFAFAKQNLPHMQFPDALHIEVGPFPVAMGRPAPAFARAWVSRSGYGVALAGETEVAHGLRLAHLFGLPAPSISAGGVAQVDLLIAGSWPASGASGFSQPQATGSAKLRGVHAEVRGVDSPLEISSADLDFSANQVRVTKLNVAAAHSLWVGSLELPRGCGMPGACKVHFDLATNELGLGELSQWVNPRLPQRPWYKLGQAPPSGPPFLASWRASGKITASHFLLRGITATHVSAMVDLDSGKLRISDLRADVLGGKHRGEWEVDFRTKPAVYSGAGTITGASLRDAGTAMNNEWATGTVGGSYRVTATGAASAEFWKSAEGTLQFDMRAGLLSHVSLVNDAGPLKVNRFQGQARLDEGKIEIKEALLASPAGAFQVSGTASLTQELKLKLERAANQGLLPTAHSYTITGTIAEPQVVLVASPETQARLKP